MSRLLTRARSRGWREAITSRIGSWRDWLSSSNTLIFLSRSTEGSFGAGQEVELRRARASDAEAYAREVGTDTPETFATRLSSGTDCYLVISGGRIVHASWVARGPSLVGEIDSVFEPPRDHAYIYESFTRPEMRGRGIYPYALAGICNRLKRESVTTAWIAVEATNRASRRAIAKAGFAVVFEVTYSKHFGRLTVDLSGVTMPEGGRLVPREQHPR